MRRHGKCKEFIGQFSIINYYARLRVWSFFLWSEIFVGKSVSPGRVLSLVHPAFVVSWVVLNFSHCQCYVCSIWLFLNVKLSWIITCSGFVSLYHWIREISQILLMTASRILAFDLWVCVLDMVILDGINLL